MQKITQLTFGNCIVFGIGFNCLTVHSPSPFRRVSGLAIKDTENGKEN